MMSPIALSKGRIVTTKMKNQVFLWKIFSANHIEAIKHTRTFASKALSHSIDGIIVSTRHWLIGLTKNHSHSHFVCFQSEEKPHDLPSLQRRYWMVFWLWTRFSNSDCERSCPVKDNKFTRDSSGRMELVVVSKTSFLEQPSSKSSCFSQPAKDYGDAGWNTCKCRCTKHGHKWLSDVLSGRFWILLGKLSVGCRQCFYLFSSKMFGEMELGGSAENSILLDKE